MKAHGSQTRASGDPYFSHPLEVAAILTDLKLDDATIVAALLHDTIEDTAATRAEIDEMFGPEIGALVDGLTKLKKLDLVTREAKQAENLRKLLLAIAADVRVLLIKLADRLHNMRTLDFMPPEARRRTAEETLDIYAPLAGRMGMHEMREELENLAFHELNPEAYRVISERLAALAARSQTVVTEIERQLTKKLAERGIDAKVTGRQKRPYSTWRKMERKAIGFEQLSDLVGYRVLVNSDRGLLPGARHRAHDLADDPDALQGLHLDAEAERLSLDPHHGDRPRQAARRAADPHPRRCTRSPNTASRRTRSTRTGTARRPKCCRARATPMRGCATPSSCCRKASNSEEFLEHTKLELFHDQVFCFTPKGRLIALPRKATAIDFAYAVHTDVGNSAVGAKINGKIAPLVSELSNGDEVEIITSKAQTAPPAAWESVVVTGKARAAIRRATRVAVRTQYVGFGRRMVERLFQRAKKEYSDEKLQGALPRLARASIEEVMAAVGRGEMRASDVARAMYPDYKEERVARVPTPKAESGWFGLRKAKSLIFQVPDGKDADDAIPIRGVSGELPVRFAPNGGAVPGDRIVGIMTPGEGITIYPIQSPALKEFEDTPERWLDVRWDVEEESPQRFPARIKVHSVNEPGSLAQVAQVIAEHDGNIDNIRMTRRRAGLHRAADRSRGLRPQAPERDHRAAQGEGRGGEGRAGERVNAARRIRSSEQ